MHPCCCPSIPVPVHPCPVGHTPTHLFPVPPCPACPACLQVRGQGNGSYTPAANAAGLNTANPPFRDTVTLPQGGWVVLRFVADNPGLWVMHCHLLW